MAGLPPPSSSSPILRSAPGLIFLVGSLAIGLCAIGTLLAVASALRRQGRMRATFDDEWSSRRKSPSRLPPIPPLVFLVPVFVFFPLSGAFAVVSVIKESTALHGASVVLDGMGRAGLWLSLHLLLPFVAPYSPVGPEWWFRRAVDGVLLLLFTGATVTHLASPYVPILSGSGRIYSHALALALNMVVLLAVNFSNDLPIQRTLVLAQLAALASDIQGIVGATKAGSAYESSRAACVIVWMALAGCWYTSSVITSHLLGDPIHLSPAPRNSPYGGYGQVMSGGSLSHLVALNSGMPSSMEMSPTFESPEIQTPGPAHDIRFRSFKAADMDCDDVGLAVSEPSGYKPVPQSASHASRTVSSEGPMETMTSTPRESQTFLSGLGLGSLRGHSRTSVNNSKSSVNLLGASTSATSTGLASSTGNNRSSVPLSTSPPSGSNRASNVLRLSRRGSSPSLSVALASPSLEDDDAVRFDPFSRQEFGAIKIQRHESGYDSTSTTPRPTPTDLTFPSEGLYERRPSQASLVLPELALPPRTATRMSPSERAFAAEINYDRRPSQTSLVEADLSFPARSPSKVKHRVSTSSTTPSEKLLSYSFPAPSLNASQTKETAAPATHAAGNTDFGPNVSRWSVSTSDQTFTKRDEWVKRDSYVRAGSLSGSVNSLSATPSRQDSLETNASTAGPGGLRMGGDDDEQEHMVDNDRTPRAQRSPLSMAGSIMARQNAGGETSPTVTRFGGDATVVLPDRVEFGALLSRIKEESPSPNSKKRPSRLDLSPTSIFRRTSPVSPKTKDASPSSPSPSPNGSFKILNPFSPTSPTKMTTPALKPLLLRPRASPPLNTSQISRPVPQKQLYPTSHVLSSSVSSTASGIIVGPSPTATRGTFGSIESPRTDSPTQPPAARGGRARAGTMSAGTGNGAGQLIVPDGGAGDRASMSTVGTYSFYEGVPTMVVASPGGRVMREEGGRKGSVPDLRNWV